MLIVIVGPGPEHAGGVPADVQADLDRLARPGIDVSYRFAGGPTAVHDAASAAAAAPHLVAAALAAARAGADAVVVDCTDDPGVAEMRQALQIPVVGAGEALRDAIADEPGEVVTWPGDALRGGPWAALLAEATDGATVALGGTGWSHVAVAVRATGRRVLDPLDCAVDRCIAGVAPPG